MVGRGALLLAVLMTLGVGSLGPGSAYGQSPGQIDGTPKELLENTDRELGKSAPLVAVRSYDEGFDFATILAGLLANAVSPDGSITGAVPSAEPSGATAQLSDRKLASGVARAEKRTDQTIGKGGASRSEKFLAQLLGLIHTGYTPEQIVLDLLIDPRNEVGVSIPVNPGDSHTVWIANRRSGTPIPPKSSIEETDDEAVASSEFIDGLLDEVAPPPNKDLERQRRERVYGDPIPSGVSPTFSGTGLYEQHGNTGSVGGTSALGAGSASVADLTCREFDAAFEANVPAAGSRRTIVTVTERIATDVTSGTCSTLARFGASPYTYSVFVDAEAEPSVCTKPDSFKCELEAEPGTGYTGKGFFTSKVIAGDFRFDNPDGSYTRVRFILPRDSN